MGISPLRVLLFGDVDRPERAASALRPLGAAVETLGAPIVCLTTIISAASLAHSRQARAAAALPPPSSGDAAAGGGDKAARASAHARGGGGGGLVVAWFVGVRLVLVPALGFGGALALRAAGVWPSDPLVALVLLVEVSAPPPPLPHRRRRRRRHP